MNFIRLVPNFRQNIVSPQQMPVGRMSPQIYPILLRIDVLKIELSSALRNSISNYENAYNNYKNVRT